MALEKPILTWSGRLLTSYEIGTTRYEYAYNADGLRTQKKTYENNILTTTVTYIWKNEKLIGLRSIAPNASDDGIIIRYLYDSNNEIIGFVYDGQTLLFAKNIQGDVVKVFGADGSNHALNLYYDAWGNVSYSNQDSSFAGIIRAVVTTLLNNITYRGYFYDRETNLYYLQSRYYDPETGRFINSDNTSFISSDNTPISVNIFAYCTNNPINYSDYNGNDVFDFLRDSKKGFLGFYNTGKSFKEFFTKPWTTIKRPWQMYAGYNDWYDRLAFVGGMKIDWLVSEFIFEHRYWRIEFWKGRYGISVGAEIGIYTNPMNLGNGFYHWTCAVDDKMNMALALYVVRKRSGKYYGKEIFYREENHWWLTGFMANVNPLDALLLDNLLFVGTILFDSPEMAKAFINNLSGKGYFWIESYGAQVTVVWSTKKYGYGTVII